jgi:hypothetical protein
MKKLPTLAASFFLENSVCILTSCVVCMLLLSRTVPYAVFLKMSYNTKDYRAVSFPFPALIDFFFIVVTAPARTSRMVSTTSVDTWPHPR